MAIMALTFPIPSGKSEQWQRFIKELQGPRRQDFAQSRKEANVRERTFLQHTPMGDMVVVTLEGPNPENAFAQFGKQTTPFAKWFQAQVKEIHGVDLTSALPPMPRQVLDTADGAQVSQGMPARA